MKILNILVPLQLEKFMKNEMAVRFRGLLFIAILITVLTQSILDVDKLSELEPNMTIIETIISVACFFLLYLLIYFLFVYLVSFFVSLTETIIKEYKNSNVKAEKIIDESQTSFSESTAECNDFVDHQDDEEKERSFLSKGKRKTETIFLSDTIVKENLVQFLKKYNSLLESSIELAMLYYVMLDKDIIIQNQSAFLDYVRTYVPKVCQASSFSVAYKKVVDHIKEEEERMKEQRMGHMKDVDKVEQFEMLDRYERMLSRLQEFIKI